jgi:hypothetical protein
MRWSKRPPKLIISDIDHTLTIDRCVPEPVVAACTALRRAGIGLTVATGRGGHNIDDVLKEHVDTLVGPRPMLAVLEHGVRTVVFEGSSWRTVEHVAIAPRERATLLQSLVGADLHSVGFESADDARRALIWTPDSAAVGNLTYLYGHRASIVNGDLEVLRVLLCAEQPGLVIVRFGSADANYVPPAGLRVAESTRPIVNLVPGSQHKGRAVAALCRRLGLDLEDVIVCGDASADREMLCLPGLRTRVIVGYDPHLNDVKSELPHETVADAEELAVYFGRLVEEPRHA